MKKLLQILVIAIIPLAALGFSGVAIYLDNIHFKESLQQTQRAMETEQKHYLELVMPHAQHEEIYDKLGRLDAAIERAKDSISYRAEQGKDATALQDALFEAHNLSSEADKAWRGNDYDKADALIDEAYVCLYEIPLAPVIPLPSPPPEIIIPAAPAPVPTPLVPIEWLLLGGVAVAAIIIGIIVWFIAFHERRDHL
ncbi:MAG: hypothetical protein KKD83_06930 [Chloroflexi bacterium]|nr:hypothetical protein [Chloroflexota bacterium]